MTPLADQLVQFTVTMDARSAGWLTEIATVSDQSLSHMAAAMLAELAADDHRAHAYVAVPRPDRAPRAPRNFNAPVRTLCPIAPPAPSAPPESLWDRQRRIDDVNRKHPVSQVDLLKALATSSVKVTKLPAGRRYVEPTRSGVAVLRYGAGEPGG